MSGINSGSVDRRIEMLQSRIRTTALYQEAQDLCRTLLRPGSGTSQRCAKIHASPDGRHYARPALLGQRRLRWLG